jgi:hypothetical protein
MIYPKKLSALHEGHMLDTEKLKHILITVDNIESSVVALDVMNKVNTDEIIKLKICKIETVISYKSRRVTLLFFFEEPFIN